MVKIIHSDGKNISTKFRQYRVAGVLTHYISRFSETWIRFPRFRLKDDFLAWWRHQMETFSELLALCAGKSLVPVNSLHKGQWCGALMFSLICARINDWLNNREAGDLRRYRGHYDVIVMEKLIGNIAVLSGFMTDTSLITVLGPMPIHA